MTNIANHVSVEPTAQSCFVRIRRIDDEKRIVEGLVYEPNVIDTWGDMMLEEDIELMAHRFMKDVAIKTSIDTQHDEKSNGSYPIESFIVRGDHHPDYSTGSWVMAVKVPDDKLWADVKSGKINGFSFQAWVTKTQAVVEVDVDIDNFGTTGPAEDGHEHTFWAEMDDDGVIISGRTSTVNGHSHLILRGTATEMAQGHAHRLPVL